MVDPDVIGAGIPERMGDFRLLERLGAGGMGVVYLARQDSLQRDVALKLILPENLFFAEARERFHREVEAAGKLHHPGIVPVYSVGEEGGLPYFAMELVEGCSLAAVIDALREKAPESLNGSDLRGAIAKRARRFRAATSSSDATRAFADTWVQACCRLVLQIAEALQHAHECGVVHRDIKPSNIVVTPSGHAMLLDFGLASDDRSSRITRTGSQAGSLPYMPPERVRGGLFGADARGDVYSLGVTLYELLAVRLPFESPTIPELLHSISSGECPPLRERNPAVPWDAATVCATAMERDPGRRYATAGAFALDLRNLLELRPILARAPTTTLRVRRWIQRHPTTSVACALGFLLLIVAPSIGWWRIKRERDQALMELRARNGMLDFLTKLIAAADPEATGAGESQSLQEVVDEGTQSIRGQFQEFPEVRLPLLLNLATIQVKLGRPREGLAMYEESLELARSLHGPDGILVAECEQGMASQLMVLGEFERAESLCRDARRIVVDKGESSNSSLLWDLDSDMATLLLMQHRYEEARERFEALGRAEDSPALKDGQERVQWLTNVGQVEKGLGRLDEADSSMREAVETATRTWGRQHTSVARALQNLAALCTDRGQVDEAMALLEEARDIRARVGARESLEDARVGYNLAAAYNRNSQLEPALAEFRRSLELCRRLAGDSMQTARATGAIGAVLFKLGRVEEAEPILRESLTLSRRFIPRQGMAAIEAPLWLARCLAKTNRAAEALPLFEEVFECLRDDPAVSPQQVAKYEGEIADVLETLGRTDEAASHREHAKEIQSSPAPGGG